MKARSQWLNYTPKVDFSISGKKRFSVNKNVNSSQFQEVIFKDPTTTPNRKSLPSIVHSSKKIHVKETKKEVEVQVETNQISRLEQQLKDKEAQLHIMKNLFNHASSRVREDDSKIDFEKVSRHRTSSIVEESIPATSVHRDNSSIIRNSSLPSIANNKYLDYAQHSAFFQPKFTRNRPKIILTNPITGVLPFY